MTITGPIALPKPGSWVRKLPKPRSLRFHWQQSPQTQEVNRLVLRATAYRCLLNCYYGPKTLAPRMLYERSRAYFRELKAFPDPALLPTYIFLDKEGWLNIVNERTEARPGQMEPEEVKETSQADLVNFSQRLRAEPDDAFAVLFAKREAVLLLISRYYDDQVIGRPPEFRNICDPDNPHFPGVLRAVCPAVMKKTLRPFIEVLQTHKNGFASDALKKALAEHIFKPKLPFKAVLP